MKPKVLFYSSVIDKKLFETQKFYKTDIDILREIGFDVLTSNRIIDFFYFWKYNYAFIYFYRYGFFSGLISRFFFKKVYFTGGIDNLDKESTTKRKYIIQRIFFKLCYIVSHRCILVSTSDYSNVKSIYRKDKDLRKISLAFHTIKTEIYNNQTCISKEDIFTTIVWMGDTGNVIRKGVDKSLYVFKELVKRYKEYSEAKFIIIGCYGEGTDYLKRICSDINIIDRVYFTGEISEEDKVEFLKKSKYYFQLSKYEGFGLAAIEALATGNIVINSGKGGLKDGIGKFGLIFDLHQNIENQIDRLHDNLQKIDQDFIDQASKHVIRNFSYDYRKSVIKKIVL